MEDDFINEVLGDDTPPAADTIQHLVFLARKARNLTRSIAELQEALKAQNTELYNLTANQLPDAMAAARLKDFTSDDGTYLEVKDYVSGALPKEDPVKRERALAYLEEIEAEDLIKNVLTLAFERKQHNEALDLAVRLRDEGYDVNVDSGVHPMTLQAFARERLRNGEPIDGPKLGLDIGRRVKITLPDEGSRM